MIKIVLIVLHYNHSIPPNVAKFERCSFDLECRNDGALRSQSQGRELWKTE